MPLPSGDCDRGKCLLTLGPTGPLLISGLPPVHRPEGSCIAVAWTGQRYPSSLGGTCPLALFSVWGQGQVVLGSQSFQDYIHPILCVSLHTARFLALGGCWLSPSCVCRGPWAP